jgi:SNF2 family DNA or RNA helicase
MPSSKETDTMFVSPATERRRLAQSGKPYKPHPYQKRAIKWLLEHNSAALFLDPGLGKTSATLAAFKYLKSKGMTTGMIVVAPLRPAQLTWPSEQEEWLDFQGLDMVLLHGDHKDKLVNEKHDIYVINYEGLPWLINQLHLGRLLKKKWVDTLVWDELTKMKNPDSSRFKLMKQWIPKFGRRWGLTGSPGSDGLMGLFGQCYVLDFGKAFGPFITHYRASFFRPSGDYGWELAQGADELIYERLKPMALRMNADELLQMPKEVPHRIPYEMPPKMRQHYEDLEEEFFALIDGEKVLGVNSGVVSGKLRQICSGALYMQEYCELTGAPMRSRNKNREFMELHDAKLDAFEELVDELNGQQVFIGYEFQHDLARIQARFGEVPYIGGGTSYKTAKKYEDAWNAGDLPWLFGHPQSVGHGLNFQKSSARNVIWYTMPWSFELYDQFNRRLRRQGNTSEFLNIYHLVARNTVEEDVMRSLANNEKIQKKMFDALRTHRQKKVAYDPEFNALATRMATLAQKQKQRQRLAESRKRA